jgi:hypothetical protein
VERSCISLAKCQRCGHSCDWGIKWKYHAKCLHLFFLLSGSGQHQELPWYLHWSSNICPGDNNCTVVFFQDLKLSIEKYKGLLLCFMLPLQHRFFFCLWGSNSKPPAEHKGGILQQNHQNSKRNCRYKLRKAEGHHCRHMPEQTSGFHVSNGLWVTTYTFPCCKAPWDHEGFLMGVEFTWLATG